MGRVELLIAPPRLVIKKGKKKTLVTLADPSPGLAAARGQATASGEPQEELGLATGWMDGDRAALGSNGDVDSRVTKVGGRDRRARPCQVNTPRASAARIHWLEMPVRKLQRRRVMFFFLVFFSASGGGGEDD